MALLAGIADLRGLITTPRDPLYEHLTDLISALEEASAPKAHGEHRSGCASHSCKFSCKRKVRKKRNKFTQSENASRAIDPSSTHSPCLVGSDSSADERKLNKQQTRCSPNCALDNMTDSDNEITKQRTWSGTVWLKPDLSHLSLGHRALVVPVESDSFTETVTPARHCRRKRLIKRMAVDQSEESPSGYANFRRHSASMEMEVSNSACSSPKCLHKRRFRKIGSCHSESSSMECCNTTSLSSSESDGINSDDAGRQGGWFENALKKVFLTKACDARNLFEGDDEQSDWCFEFPKIGCNNSQQDECMGVPNLRKMLIRKAHRDSELEQTTNSAPTIESSDTDMSQSSCCFRNYVKNCGRRLLHKSGPSMSSALNKRLVNFLRDSIESEFHLGTLRKRERKEILRLASFYHLNVQCKTSKGVHTYSLLKTKYSVFS